MTASKETSEKADECFVLSGARLVGASQELVDLTIDAGRVAAITPADAQRPGHVEVVDLGGRFVLSGLWDHHVHMSQWALHEGRLDLSGARSAADTVALVAEHLARSSPGELVVGVGFRDALWPDVPTTELLDAVSSRVPVVLASNDLHCGWLNSPALARYADAVPADGLDPWATIAAAVHRSDDGRPSWHPEQQLTRQVALDCSTVGGATVRTGAAANLVVVDVDPLAATPAELRAISSQATLCGGRWTWWGM